MSASARKAAQQRTDALLAQMSGGTFGGGGGFGGGGPSFASAPSVAGGGDINITIQNVNVPPGTTKEQVRIIMKEIADELKKRGQKGFF
jgi:hypothetical protein